MIGLFILGLIIGGYGAWATTWLYFKTRDERDDGDGGIDIPDFVPDDLLDAFHE